MTDLPEFDFILRVRGHYFHQYTIKQIKMPNRMSSRAASRAGAAGVCALAGARMRARKHAILHERGARRRNAILEHAGPVLGSALGKIGQRVNRGW